MSTIDVHSHYVPGGWPDLSEVVSPRQDWPWLRVDSENFAAAQEARARLEAAQATPVRRTDTLHLTGETFAQRWAATNLEGRRQMLAGNLAEPVRLMPGKPKQGPGRGKVVNLDRITTSWLIDEPDPEEDPVS